MVRFRRRIIAATAIACSGLAAMTVAATPASAAAAASSTTLNGAGSSWAAVAILNWDAHMRQRGLIVNFTPSGSAAGRVAFIQGQEDFAASDVPFDNGSDKLAGTAPEVPHNSYSYVPDVAGGVAFLYHLTVNGQKVTNLRLSAPTLRKIFTGEITNWDDPRITADNGRQLPSLRITPVVRSDAAGTSYFFSSWLSRVYPGDWNSFCARFLAPGVKPPCGPTQQYPVFAGARGEDGATDAANFIRATNGAIGYDEYAYALQAKTPVVALRNPAGDYVRPTAADVTTALTQASINDDRSSPDFLQEDLSKVYTSTSPSSYPISYYSYLIVPRKPNPPAIFGSPAGKGKSLTAYINYALCGGQRHLDRLGYAELPPSIVNRGLQIVRSIPGHGPVLSRCGD